ncbi:MAG: hypothetical protein AAB526_00430 [Patescibacteria group bacterium]
MTKKDSQNIRKYLTHKKSLESKIIFNNLADFHQLYNLHKDNANDTEDSGVVSNPFSLMP